MDPVEDIGHPAGETGAGLQLTKQQWEQMEVDVRSRAPEEACGLLAGSQGRVKEVIPVTNSLRSSVRFRMDPQEQWQAFQSIEENGWVMLGIYHSHPGGPSVPSATDIAEAYYPEAIHLIWSPSSGGAWRCRGFRIQGGEVREVPILIRQSE